MNQEIITSLYQKFGPLQSVKPIIVTHGYANEVFILPEDNLVVRVPRNEWAGKRQETEALILEQLSQIELGFEITHIRHLSTSPSFIVTSYIEGDVYSREEIIKWDDTIKVDFGTQLGTFLWNVHTRASVNQYTTLVGNKPLLIDEFRKDIVDFGDDSSQLYRTAYAQYDILSRMMSLYEYKNAVVHGDIHSANLVFDKNKSLVGVLDFADVSIEPIYADFRRVYMLDPVVFEACIDTYEILSSSKVDRSLAKQWAIVHELSVLCRHYYEPNYPSIPRARDHIIRWLA